MFIKYESGHTYEHDFNTVVVDLHVRPEDVKVEGRGEQLSITGPQLPTCHQEAFSKPGEQEVVYTSAITRLRLCVTRLNQQKKHTNL